MTNRPWPAHIIVWSRNRAARLFAVAALMVLTFAVDGPVARSKAYATLAEAIAATLPAGSFTQEAYLKASNPNGNDLSGPRAVGHSVLPDDSVELVRLD